MWESLQLPVKHMILDEANLAKNPEEVTHACLKAVHCILTIVVTDKLMPSKWRDCRCLLDFLPGHVFGNQKQFNRVFIGLEFTSNIGWSRLIKFLQAVVVARPAKFLADGIVGITKAAGHFEDSTIESIMAKVRLEDHEPHEIPPIIPYL